MDVAVDVFAQWKCSPRSSEPRAALLLVLNPKLLEFFKGFFGVFIQAGMAVGGQKDEDE